MALAPSACPDSFRLKGLQMLAQPEIARLFPSVNFLMIVLITIASGTLVFFGYYPRSPLVFVFVMSGWLVSLCLHEFGHALVAYWGGDTSVETRGYLSLDPMRYVQPGLSLFFPMLFVAMGGFGFPGGAVYIDHRRLRGPGIESLVSAAGPAATLLCLILLLIPFWLGLQLRFDQHFWGAIAFLAFLQITALVLNLLPLPGFDGFGIVAPFLPVAFRAQATAAGTLAGLILIALLILVPAFNHFFFGIVDSLGRLFGLDPSLVGYGQTLFRFWTPR
jgi:Zn-dependent protease